MDLAIIGCNGLDKIARENSMEVKISSAYMSKNSRITKTFSGHKINLCNGHALYIDRDSVGLYDGKSYFYPSEIDYKTIFVGLKQAGIKNVMSLSPVGSLEPLWKQDNIVLIASAENIRKFLIEKQPIYIAKIICRPYIRDYIDFVNRDIILDDMGTDYIDTTESFDNGMNEKILDAAKRIGVHVFDGGIYLMGISGVRFETMAEIELFKRISKEKTVVGMIVPTESQLCKLLGMNYSSLSVVVNTIMSKKRTSHRDSENALTKFLQNSLKIADIVMEKGKL